MKFIFKPQTSILVAGLLAAAYAEACYYQATSAVCIAAGTTGLDSWVWDNGGGTVNVTASSDWIIYASPNHHLVVSGSGTYKGYGSDGGTIPAWCTGPVHFADASNNTVSVTSWSAYSITSGTGVTPGDAGIYEGTAGSPGC